MKLLINSAIEAFDLVEYLVARGGKATQPGQWILTCPICGKLKLAVHTDKKAYHCWICEQYGPAEPRTGKRQIIQGAGGLLDLVQLLEGIDRLKAIEFVLLHSGVQSQGIEQIEGVLKAQQIASVILGRPTPIPPPLYAQPIDGNLTYLQKRGISLEDARAFGLFWCSGGRYQNRLIFPVYENGVLVHYQGRAMWELLPGEKKSLNPHKGEGGAVSSEVLFNLDMAKQYPRVAITEGPVDAVKVGYDAVCTFGKKISSVQIAKLLRARVKALDFMWDGPSEREPYGAWPEMIRTAPTLAALFDIRLVFLPYGDPGQRTREENTWLRTQGKPISALGKTAMI